MVMVMVRMYALCLWLWIAVQASKLPDGTQLDSPEFKHQSAIDIPSVLKNVSLVYYKPQDTLDVCKENAFSAKPETGVLMPQCVVVYGVGQAERCVPAKVASIAASKGFACVFYAQSYSDTGVTSTVFWNTIDSSPAPLFEVSEVVSVKYMLEKNVSYLTVSATENKYAKGSGYFIAAVLISVVHGGLSLWLLGSSFLRVKSHIQVAKNSHKKFTFHTNVAGVCAVCLFISSICRIVLSIDPMVNFGVLYFQVVVFLWGLIDLTEMYCSFILGYTFYLATDLMDANTPVQKRKSFWLLVVLMSITTLVFVYFLIVIGNLDLGALTPALTAGQVVQTLNCIMCSVFYLYSRKRLVNFIQKNPNAMESRKAYCQQTMVYLRWSSVGLLCFVLFSFCSSVTFQFMAHGKLTMLFQALAVASTVATAIPQTLSIQVTSEQGAISRKSLDQQQNVRPHSTTKPAGTARESSGNHSVGGSAV